MRGKGKTVRGKKNADASTETIASLSSRLNKGEVSAVEVCANLQDVIERNKSLNAFIHVTRELAMAQAAASDARIRKGEARPLEGIPLSVKGNMCLKGVESTAASAILKGFVPTYSAAVVDRIMEAGAVVVGATNLDEFGMGSSTENSVYGPTVNPIGAKLGRMDLAPGGSSGGAAAAVAADMCLGSLATDTGGSIRQPSAFCGVVGYKPSYGLCSRWGIMAYASSMDQAGAICKTVEDAALVADVMIGEDPRDSTSVSWDEGSLAAALKTPRKKWRVGLPKEFREVVQSPILQKTWKETERCVEAFGGEIVEVSLPNVRYALPTYYIIALSEASSNLARYDGVRYGHRSGAASDIIELYEKSRGEGFGRETRKRVLLGTYCLSAGYLDEYYNRARRVRTLIAEDFRRAFEKVDVLAWPTAPTPAFPFGSHADDPLTMYLEDVFTVPVNLAWLPAISVPVTLSQEGLPMGLTIAGPAMGDQTVIRAAADFEQARDLSR